MIPCKLSISSLLMKQLILMLSSKEFTPMFSENDENTNSNSIHKAFHSFQFEPTSYLMHVDKLDKDDQILYVINLFDIQVNTKLGNIESILIKSFEIHAV